MMMMCGVIDDGEDIDIQSIRLLVLFAFELS